jgi:hypothetical protein
MSTKRGSATAGAIGSPLADAILLSSAVGLGLWILIERGNVPWPPTHLLSNANTMAGCLAIVGPLVLLRRGSGGSIGELCWMTGGLLVWLFDFAALLKGNFRSVAWTAPLGYQPMALTMLAVLLAGWRARGAERDWSWTNLVGWVLALFWIGAGVTTFFPSRTV